MTSMFKMFAHISTGATLERKNCRQQSQVIFIKKTQRQSYSREIAKHRPSSPEQNINLCEQSVSNISLQVGTVGQ